MGIKQALYLQPCKAAITLNAMQLQLSTKFNRKLYIMPSQLPHTHILAYLLKCQSNYMVFLNFSIYNIQPSSKRMLLSKLLPCSLIHTNIYFGLIQHFGINIYSLIWLYSERLKSMGESGSPNLVNVEHCISTFMLTPSF